MLWEKVEVDTNSPLPNCSDKLPIVMEWSSTVTRQDTIAWISGLPPEDPFFAYVAFNAPHEPLQVPPFMPPLGLVSPATATEISNLGYVAGDFPPDATRDCVCARGDVH
jgi:hypothetical protein